MMSRAVPYPLTSQRFACHGDAIATDAGIDGRGRRR
jgi:hypothetical protein